MTADIDPYYARYSLYGISTTQAYIYASHSTEDPFSLKALVASVWSVVAPSFISKL